VQDQAGGAALFIALETNLDIGFLDKKAPLGLRQEPEPPPASIPATMPILTCRTSMRSTRICRISASDGCAANPDFSPHYGKKPPFMA